MASWRTTTTSTINMNTTAKADASPNFASPRPRRMMTWEMVVVA